MLLLLFTSYCYFQVKSQTGPLCIDTLQRDEKAAYNMGVFVCQGEGSASQFLSLTPNGQLRRELSCATVKNHFMKMVPCSDRKSNANWEYNKTVGFCYLLVLILENPNCRKSRILT